MEVHIGPALANAELWDPDDFTSLRVVIHGEKPVLTVPAGWGLRGHEFLIPITALRCLAGARAEEDTWCQGLAQMIEYAHSRGWMHQDGQVIRAHVAYANGR